MKILAVPVARHRNPARLPYITYLPKLTRPFPGIATTSSQRMMQYVSNVWTQWGRPDTKSLLGWKNRVYSVGERIMDSIEYEEWALKGIDQVLGPSIQRLLSRSHQTAPDAHTHVSVLYPPSLISRPSVLESLQRMSTHRAPLHNRQFLYNMVAIPVTAPLFLVPAIPNVVTYYFMWRAWSHWRAYQALQSLQSLIRHDLVKFEPDEQLDALFQHSRPPPSDLSTDCAWLLDQSCMNRIVDDYTLPAQAYVDLRRASKQAIHDIIRSGAT